jgi:hypothetical protein
VRNEFRVLKEEERRYQLSEPQVRGEHEINVRNNNKRVESHDFIEWPHRQYSFWVVITEKLRKESLSAVRVM